MHPILALQYQLDMILSEVCLTMLLSSFPRHESLPGAILLQPHLPSRLSISDSAIECWFDNWEPPLAVAANLQALAKSESETNNMLIQHDTTSTALSKKKNFALYAPPFQNM